MRTLFYNGEILTMESPRPAQAVLTEGKRILAVGDLSAIAPLAGRSARRVDLQGGALIPGFADCGGSFGSSVRRHLPADAGSREIRTAAHRVWEDYIRLGYSTVCAGGLDGDTAAMLACTDLPSPLLVTADVWEMDRVLRATVGSRGRLRLCGVTLDLDAREDGGEATGRLAYCDRAVGYALHAAAAAGLPPIVRAESTASVEQLLRVARALSRAYPALPATRPVLLDARALSPLAAEKMRAVGGIPCFAADVILQMGDDILATRGLEEASRLIPCAAARRVGLPFTLCGANAGQIPDPLALLSAAVRRRTARGILLGEGERAGVYDALRGLTVHGAWQYHAEHAWGSIRAGMQADMALLDRSPLAVSTRELEDIRCVATWIGGELVWHDFHFGISTRQQRVPNVYESFIK